MTLEALFTAFVETGDETSLERVFRRCAPALRRHARRLGHAGEDAEDLVQETMVTAVQRADSFRDAEKLLPWLKGILARKAAHLARKDARRLRATRAFADRQDDPAEGEESGVRASSGSLALAELTRLVEQAIPALPDKYHEPLRMQLLEGKSPNEIARALGMPRATTRVQLYRGMRLLRQRLPKSVTPGLLLVLLAPNAMAMAGGGPGTGMRIAVGASAIAAVTALAWGVLSGDGGSSSPPEETSIAAARLAGIRGTLDDHADSVATRKSVPLGPEVASPGELEVLVRSVDGEPVSGVGVRAVPVGWDPLLVTRRARTGADGVVRFGNLRGSVVEVSLDRGTSARVDLASDTRAATYAFTVDAGLSVRGRVVDADGEIVPHAQIWLSDSASGPWSGQVVSKANASGEFALLHVQPGSFVASLSEHRARSGVVRVSSRAESEPIELRMGADCGVVEGRVIDPDGEPVADAVVLVGESMDGATLWLSDGAAGWRPPPVAVRTRLDGSFQSTQLERDWHPVYVRARGFAPYASAVRVDSDAEIVVHLQRGSELEGRVVDDLGRGIGGATVVYSEFASEFRCELESAEDGAFALWIPAKSRGMLVARAAGRVPQAVEVAAAPPPFLDLHLPRQASIRGRFVRRGTDDGLAGFWFRCGRPAPQRVDDGYVLVESDDEGRFDSPPLRHAAPLWIRGPGESLWRDARDLAQWNRDELRVEVPSDWFATGAIEGVLRDDHGLPAARCRLFVTPAGGIPLEVGSTDVAGRFSVSGLPAGGFDLFAESTSATSPAFEVGTVQVAAGATTRIERRAHELGRVTVELTRSDGGKIGDAVVTIIGGSPRRRYALLNGPRGTRSLEPGSYELWAMGSRFAWVEGRALEVRANSHSTVEVAVDPAVRRKLMLTGLPAVSSDTVWRCRIVGVDSDREHGRYSLAANAMPALGGVFPIGRYRLEVHGPEGAVWQAEFAVDSLAPRWRALQLELVMLR